MFSAVAARANDLDAQPLGESDRSGGLNRVYHPRTHIPGQNLFLELKSFCTEC